MLDEFILEQLDRIEDEYLELNQKLADLTEQEKAEQVQLNKYLDADDLGLELFSPRSNAGPIKEKVSEIQKHLEELRILQIETTDRIARNREKEEKYQQMLNEAADQLQRMLEKSDEQIKVEDESSGKSQKRELRKTYSKLVRNLSPTDSFLMRFRLLCESRGWNVQ